MKIRNPKHEIRNKSEARNSKRGVSDFGFSICFGFLISCFVLFQSLELHAQETSNHWKRLPDLPDPIGVAGAFAGVSGGALIVAGGANFPDAPPWEGGTKVWHDTIWALKKPDGEWREVGKLPKPNGYGVSISVDGTLFGIGGGSADQNFTNVFVLNATASGIEQREWFELPEQIANSCGAFVDLSLCVAGGVASPTSTVALSTFLTRNLLSGSRAWIKRASWPGPARQLAVAGSCSNTFYLFGGTSLESGPDGKPVRTYLRDAYAFTINHGWKRIADLPFPLAASPSPAATVNGKLIIFGGDDAPSADPKTHKGFRDEMLEYDPAADKWTIIGRVPAPRVTAPVVFWNGGYVVVSGEIRRGVRSREVWMWTP